MSKIRPGSITKVCLTLLSFSLLSSCVFGSDINQVAYSDRASNAYLYNKVPNTMENILNINSPEARTVETTLKLDNTANITNSNAVINLSLRDSDIKQVLRMLADKANLNIVFDESVDGKVTLDLNNTNINDAFMIIFKSLQLTYFKDGKTITVTTLDKAKDLAYTKKSMTVLPIRYVNSADVANFLNDNLFKSNIYGLSNQPIVTSNARTNQIIVFGSPADVLAVKRVLPILDTKPLINNFKVNHTTPKEMAELVCQALIKTDGESSSSSSSDSKSDSDDEVVLGGGTLACRISQKSGGGSGGASGGKSGGDGSLTSFDSGALSVVYFPELGSISTYGGSVEQAEVIKQFIKDNDKKQLMAYVELSVIELNESGSREFSNEWSLWTPFVNLSFTTSDGIQTTSPIYLWGDHTKSNIKALTYKLKYLIENGNGRVLTNPKIMVTNGKKSVIDMTSDYVKSVTSQILESSSSITAGTQKTYDIGSDEGLKIEIVPFISPDGYVSMNIVPEFSTIKQQITAKGVTGDDELQATLLQRRDLELKNIRIKDGETLVLAGMIQESETQTTKKMPFLSDLPFVGVFFRGNTTNKSRQELVIVVTPHIVKDGDEALNDKIYDL